MAENSAIQWTHHTFNPWSGCTKVSAGCANCYAEVNYSVKMRGVKWGPQGNRIVKAESGWKEPEKWNRDAQQLEDVSRALMNAPIPLCTADIASRFHWQMRHTQAVLDDLAAAEIVIPNKGNLGGYYHSEDTRLRRPRVFCASLADVFEDWKGDMLISGGERLFVDSNTGEWQVAGDLSTHRPLTMQDVRERLFRLIDATPNLDWLLLTKRPENIAKMMPPWGIGDFHDRDVVCTMSAEPRPNLWLGVSVENQQAADERIPHLLRAPAAVRFLSVEPLLGRLELYARGWLTGRIPGQCGSCVICRHPVRCRCPGDGFPSIDWVIVGGESGHGARPCNVAWVRSIRDQCKDAGVACFVKQLGAKPFEMRQDPTYACEHEEERFIHLNDKKGGNPDEWPDDLRVREFPR